MFPNNTHRRPFFLICYKELSSSQSSSDPLKAHIKYICKHACNSLALISRSKYLLFLCTAVQNTDWSSSHVPLISSFALSFCWQLPQDWKPEMVSAENLMGLMESLLMEARGALCLPPPCSVLQHRWYLIPFAPQWYMRTPATQFCEGIRGGLQHALKMRRRSLRSKWRRSCIQTDNHGEVEDFFISVRDSLCALCPAESQKHGWSASVARTALREPRLLID